jgi:hypothetical protein
VDEPSSVTSWSSFVYGIVLAVIGATGTQVGIWINASKRRQIEDQRTDAGLAMAKLARDGETHDQFVAMLTDRLHVCESERARWGTERDQLEQRSIDLRRELARTRFYAGVLRGILVTNKIAVPDMASFDIQVDRDISP